MNEPPVAFDTETALIAKGLRAPPLVCMSIAHEDGDELLHHSEAREWIEALLGSDRLLVGANIAFDFGVVAARWPDLVPAIFRAYEEDRVTDVIVREKLQHIAIGVYRGYETTSGDWRHLGYSLEEIAARRLRRKLDKDTWRLRYGELIDTPIVEWPEGAKAYARDDARTTLDVYLDQENEGAEYLPNEFAQARAAWWLHLMSSWGLHTDRAAVEALAERLEARFDEVAEHLHECGLILVEASRNTDEIKRRVVASYGGTPPLTAGGAPKTGAAQLKHAGLGLLADLNSFTRKTKQSILAFPHVETLIDEGLVEVRDVKNIGAASDLMVRVCEEQGVEVPYTDKGNVKLDKDVCRYVVKHDDLSAFAEYSGLSTKLSNFVPLLFSGVDTPIQANFESLLETGRTSSSPNVQNLPRKGGVRECFIPRSGKVFAAADYSSFELRTMAQVCLDLFGFSHLAEALNAGFDPHLEVARRVLGISYDEARRRLDEGDDKVDNARQVGKVANFGFPGGLGPTTFVIYARKSYGVEITEERAAALKRYWLEAWPEFNHYFAWVGKLCEDPMPRLKQLRVERYRGGVSFCEACNSLFQGLAADGAKRAGFLIARACYVDETSPLFGSRLVNFIHDEFIVETDDDENAHDVAVELARLMIEGASPFVPNVPPLAEPYLMRRWSKKAKPLFDDGGRLVPWDGMAA